jgi:hypothetical protein
MLRPFVTPMFATRIVPMMLTDVFIINRDFYFLYFVLIALFIY